MQQQPFVPEKHFTKVPEKLSGNSEIVSIRPYETSPIINPEEAGRLIKARDYLVDKLR